MRDIDTLKQIKIQLLTEMKEDYVGLWFIVSLLKEQLAIEDQQQLMDQTLQLLHQLMKDDGVKIGSFGSDDNDFHYFSMKPDDAVEFVRKEWSALGKEPDLGDVAWFTIASSGKSG